MSAKEIPMKSALRQARVSGFTLIELMIALVVLTILVSVAMPTYQHAVRESRRTDAKTAVLDIAAREQRYYSLTNSFTTSLSNLGYTSNTSATSVDVGSNYYSVAVTQPTTTTFLVTATPVAGTSQASDSSCQQFTVDNTGLQKSQDGSGNDTTSTCW